MGGLLKCLHREGNFLAINRALMNRFLSSIVCGFCFLFCDADALTIPVEESIQVDRLLSYEHWIEPDAGTGYLEHTIRWTIEYGTLFRDGSYVVDHVGVRAAFWYYDWPDSPPDYDFYNGPIAYSEWALNRTVAGLTEGPLFDAAFPWISIGETFTKYPNVWELGYRHEVSWKKEATDPEDPPEPPVDDDEDGNGDEEGTPEVSIKVDFEPILKGSTVFMPATKRGKKSLQKLFTVTNKGLTPLRVKRPTLKGRERENFEIETFFFGVLDPGESATFLIRFQPRKVGISRASIKIESSASDSKIPRIKLKGRGK